MRPTPSSLANTLRTLSLTLCSMVLGGLVACSHAPLAMPNVPLADAQFAPPSQPVTADDLFTLSEPMQAFVNAHLVERPSQADAHEALLKALYDRQLLQLRYDDGPTRTAAQAFDARKGNCLSLVVMTAAFAKAVGLEVDYRLALNTGQWRYDGQTLLRTDHVNLVLTPTHDLSNRGLSRRQSLMVDFLPGEDLSGLRTRAITERRLIALFLNNRAAENLSAGQINQAYWWARAAALQDPTATAALNTLGLVYARSQQPALAEQTYNLVLQQDPDNTFALYNLMQLLQTQGRNEQAAGVQQRLARLEAQPPLHWQTLGRVALQGADAQRALDLFERELDRSGPSANLMFELAQAHFRLGHQDLAEQALTQAAELSGRTADRDRYYGKLAWLRAQSQP